LNESKSRNLTHPVWNIYDQLKTARLNVLYYEAKLQFAERAQTSIQVILAATVPSSTVAGFDIWDFGLGQYAWELFASSASSIAFIQPFLGLTKKVKTFDELVSGYKTLYYDLQDIRQKIEEEKSYTNSHKKLFNAAKERRKRLEIKETGISVNKKLRRKCQEAVKNELPAKNFFIPDEN
jgi:hypothetical protein